MKKLLVLLLAVCLVFSSLTMLTGCGKKDDGFKVGFIFLHDETSTYDKNFIDAAKEAVKALGLTDEQVIMKVNVPESVECYNAAADLVDQGCDVIFADSFGHEEHMIKAAKEFKDVQFCHATGVKAHTEKLPNYHNAFADIYMGRFLVGIAAGMKLNEMIQNGKITEEQAVMGYVGAYPYAEVKSGYTSFYLGAKSICPSVTMMVDFTGSWYSVDKERDIANSLMDKGAVLISQHADSLGAPSACENRKVPNVSYNGSTQATCPETFIVSSRINWVPYFDYMIKCVQNGEAIKDDWCGTLENGAVVLTDINTSVAAAGTAEKIAEVTAKLKNGEIKVFDTNNFTVKGEKLTSYLADVDDAGDFKGETEVVINGIFEESVKRSAPYFDIDIDGITILGDEK